MFKSSLSKVARLLTRQSGAAESGQAIIILALGFIGLIAFVGIVTDVSLMFVRYSTLSRAVDSAAIAAAGQMRSDRNFGEVGVAARQFIEFHGLDPEQVKVETCQSNPKDTEDEDNDGIEDEPHPALCPQDQRKLVRVSATIQSPTVFMRLLGFNTLTLTAVALSETAVLDVVVLMDVSESMLFDTTYEDWARIGMGKVYIPPRIGGNRDVQVREQDELDVSGNPLPTAKPSAGDGFTGWDPLDEGTIYQLESIDHLSSLGSGTEDPNLWVPTDYADPVPNFQKFWDDLVINSTHETLSQRLFYQGGSNHPNADDDYAVQVFDYPDAGALGTFPGFAGGAGGQAEPRPLCRVRFWPNSIRVPVLGDTLDTYDQVAANPEWTRTNWDGFVPTYNFYGCCNDPSANGTLNPETGAWESLTGSMADVRADAGNGHGDFRFNDLICQPFKQARDATRQFLERIDFARGDRVAFVTYDKMAFLIDPDGANGAEQDAGNTYLCADEGEAEYIDHDDDPNTPKRTQQTHMIQSACRAQRTLDQYLGVRAEPNSYAWNEDGGGWEAYADGLDELGRSKVVNYFETRFDVPEDEWYDPAKGNVPLNTYPVRDHCPLQNGALGQLYSRYSSWKRGDFQQYGIADPGLRRIMIPDPMNGTWAGSGIDERNSYELWATCRNTNVGAALRTGSNALLDPSTTRRTGTVWVMVMLGDGAAGGSDPVRQNGNVPREGSFIAGGSQTDISIYADRGTDESTWESYGVDGDGDPFVNNIRYGTNNPGVRAQYGAFGLCPIGTEGGRSSLTRVYNPGDIARFPFCSDEIPDSRHFCRPSSDEDDWVGGECPANAPMGAELGTIDTGEWAYGFSPGAKDRRYVCNPDPADMLPNESVEDYNLRRGRIYDADIGDWYSNLNESSENETTCDPLYDVDDYARDWADYIGLSQDTGELQLPIIFTIGFGLNFEVGSNGLPPDDPGYVPGGQGQNVADYLGEELLRYIADVGDNNEVDTDYQQDYRDNRIRDGSVVDWGLRGPCERAWSPMEEPFVGYSGPLPAVMPLPARQSCGNYYNAPNQAQLELVFDDIASRMFTRLTG